MKDGEAAMEAAKAKAAEESVTSSPAAMALAWAVVAVPAAWGIYNTVLRAANLFTK